MDLPRHLVRRAIETALAEDLGRSGDITSTAVIDADQRSSARIVVRAPGVIAGLPLACEVFTAVDPTIDTKALLADGDRVTTGDVLAEVSGSTRSMLTAERTALNFLGHLSGIATATRAMVDLVADTGARIVDTRKTTPGLRALEKYAVSAGGGMNHRFGLDDAVLIKDNHLAATGSIAEAVTRARRSVGHVVRIEVEVDDLNQLREALTVGVDAVLLDNMTPAQLHEAVAITAGRAVTEASGGITLETVAEVARTGVDLISTGWITHSAPNLDVALDF